MNTPANTPQQPLDTATPPADSVAMGFRDGSRSWVPKAQVTDAMLNDGGELLHQVVFPDSPQAHWVRHSDLPAAFHDGGRRVDANPNVAKPVRWQDAVGSIWDVLTGTGAEVGPAAAQGGGGTSISSGLTNAGSGHPIKGAAQIASGVAEGISPALGASALPEAAVGAATEAAASAATEEAGQATASVAADMPAKPGAKELLDLVKEHWDDFATPLQKAEVGGDKLSAEAWNSIVEKAMAKAADASSKGQGTAAAGFSAAAKVAKVLETWDSAWATLGSKWKGVPVALKLLGFKGFLDTAEWAGEKAGVLKPDKDDARDDLFGR